jgi:endonuclease III
MRAPYELDWSHQPRVGAVSLIIAKIGENLQDKKYMHDTDIHEAIRILQIEVDRWPSPAVTIVAQRDGNPFKVLVSCVLSLRTKDTTTGPAAERLFALAETPEAMQLLPIADIERAIYPVGFYRIKATQIHHICQRLVRDFQGKVPAELETLLSLPGVGRKTANLVVTLGFRKPGICVDTHVHRICNRWGYVATKTAEQTEYALRGKLPAEYWLMINDLLVAFGQHLCKPISPFCSLCRLVHLCSRVGVGKSR